MINDSSDGICRCALKCHLRNADDETVLSFARLLCLWQHTFSAGMILSRLLFLASGQLPSRLTDVFSET